MSCVIGLALPVKADPPKAKADRLDQFKVQVEGGKLVVTGDDVTITAASFQFDRDAQTLTFESKGDDCVTVLRPKAKEGPHKVRAKKVIFRQDGRWEYHSTSGEEAW